MPIFVLLPRKRPIDAVVKKFGKKMVLCWEGKNWIDDALTTTYLEKVIQVFALIMSSCSVIIGIREFLLRQKIVGLGLIQMS